MVNGQPLNRAPRSRPPAALSVRGLTKTYGAVNAVVGLSFDVSPGTIVALVGPIGSGKTTVLRMVLGLIEPDSGNTHFGGHRSNVAVFDHPSSALELLGGEKLVAPFRRMTENGIAVLLSADIASDVAYADEFVVMNAGRQIVHAPVDELLAGAARTASIRVRTTDTGRLAEALAAQGHACVHIAPDALRIHDVGDDKLRWLVRQAGVVTTEIVAEPPDLDTVIAAYIDRSALSRA
jgi:ABC-type multidrug transport system ATPase subunit